MSAPIDQLIDSLDAAYSDIENTSTLVFLDGTQYDDLAGRLDDLNRAIDAAKEAAEAYRDEQDDDEGD